MNRPNPASVPPEFGALVLSLDFELAWGVRDSLGENGRYRANLIGARDAVPRILDLLVRYEAAATWATVGFLFAESREELQAFSPDLRPAYADPRRDPYQATLGTGERDDPLHFAPSLIRAIASAPRQEIGSHTFSHYYCMEPGQTEATFEADLRAAVAIAAARGYPLRSLVVPRHQVRADYLPAVVRAGLQVHRSNEANRLSRPRATGQDPHWVRVARLLDTYVPLTGTNEVPWSDTEPDAHGLIDVRESRFLRPVSRRVASLEPLRRARMIGAMRSAATKNALLHVWWHPHNFGVALEENLANLRALLDTYSFLREEYGFASYAMGDFVATRPRAGTPTR